MSLYPNQTEPIFMPKRDRFNERLAFVLHKPPIDYQPSSLYDPLKLHILLPYFKNLDTFRQTYISPNSQKAFVNSVHQTMIALFIDSMLENYIQGFTKYHGIRCFIEKYDLSKYPYMEEKLNKLVYRSIALHKKYPKRKYDKQSE